MHVLLVICVLMFAGFWFLATWPVNYADRIAKGFLLVAAVIWGIQALSGGA
jgi:hypothetical protein